MPSQPPSSTISWDNLASQTEIPWFSLLCIRAMILATTGCNLELAALALARQSASTDTTQLAFDSPDPILISYQILQQYYRQAITSNSHILLQINFSLKQLKMNSRAGQSAPSVIKFELMRSREVLERFKRAIRNGEVWQERQRMRERLLQGQQMEIEHSEQNRQMAVVDVIAACEEGLQHPQHYSRVQVREYAAALKNMLRYCRLKDFEAAQMRESGRRSSEWQPSPSFEELGILVCLAEQLLHTEGKRKLRGDCLHAISQCFHTVMLESLNSIYPPSFPSVRELWERSDAVFFALMREGEEEQVWVQQFVLGKFQLLAACDLLQRESVLQTNMAYISHLLRSWGRGAVQALCVLFVAEENGGINLQYLVHIVGMPALLNFILAQPEGLDNQPSSLQIEHLISTLRLLELTKYYLSQSQISNEELIGSIRGLFIVAIRVYFQVATGFSKERLGLSLLGAMNQALEMGDHLWAGCVRAIVEQSNNRQAQMMGIMLLREMEDNQMRELKQLVAFFDVEGVDKQVSQYLWTVLPEEVQ